MSGYVPPCFPFVLGTGKVVERFISFDVPVLSCVFGYGNKLLSWPNTNLTVSFMCCWRGAIVIDQLAFVLAAITRLTSVNRPLTSHSSFPVVFSKIIMQVR